MEKFEGLVLDFCGGEFFVEFLYGFVLFSRFSLELIDISVIKRQLLLELFYSVR